MKPSKDHHRFVTQLYWCVLIMLFVLSVSLPKIGVVFWVNQNHSEFQDEFWKLVTHLGEGWIFVPILIYTLFVRISLSLATVSIALIHGSACQLLKRTIFSNQLRPTAVINNELLYLIPDVTFHSHYSFPSGHTATIFCFAVYLSLLVKHRLANCFFLLIALLVGYSRIYLLQHFLLDVTAGAFIGTITAFLVAYTFDRNNFPTWANSRILIAR